MYNLASLSWWWLKYSRNVDKYKNVIDFWSYTDLFCILLKYSVVLKSIGVFRVATKSFRSQSLWYWLVPLPIQMVCGYHIGKQTAEIILWKKENAFLENLLAYHIVHSSYSLLFEDEITYVQQGNPCQNWEKTCR
jgi:hypothetical protein